MNRIFYKISEVKKHIEELKDWIAVVELAINELLDEYKHSESKEEKEEVSEMLNRINSSIDRVKSLLKLLTARLFRDKVRSITTTDIENILQTISDLINERYRILDDEDKVFVTTVDKYGRVTIPSYIRKSFNLKYNDDVELVLIRKVKDNRGD